MEEHHRRIAEIALSAAGKLSLGPAGGYAVQEAVAKPIPLSRRQHWLPAAEVGHELSRLGPDTTGLADELRSTLTEPTDDLPLLPPRQLLGWSRPV